MSTSSRSRSAILALSALVVLVVIAVVVTVTRPWSADPQDDAAGTSAPSPGTVGKPLNDVFVITYAEDSSIAQTLSSLPSFGSNILDQLPADERQALLAAAEKVSVTIESVAAHAGGVVSVALSELLSEDQIARFTRLLEDDEDIEAVDHELRMTTLDVKGVNGSRADKGNRDNGSTAAADAPNDEFYPRQWHMGDQAYGVHAARAWQQSTGTDVTVAVIDTGILPNHPDLDNQLLPGYDFISDQWMAGDGDGRDDDPSDEGDYTETGDCEDGVEATDSSWHGSHIAGIIAAKTDNSIGVAGVAPDSKVLPVRAMGRCGGRGSDIIDALTWASGGHVNGVPDNPNPADVINLSLGGASQCPRFYQRAIDKAVSRGSIIVVAAGNENQDAAQVAPANCDNVITVGSTGPAGTRAEYSNYGQTVDVSAPGGDVPGRDDDVEATTILSTVDKSATTPREPVYGFAIGTSQAAPHVAGTLALLLALNPDLTTEEAVTILQDSAVPLSSCDRDACSAGIVDAAAAVESLGSQGSQDPGERGRGWVLRPGPRDTTAPEPTRRPRS